MSTSSRGKSRNGKRGGWARAMRCVHLCVIPICFLSFGPESGEPAIPPPLALVKKVRGHAASTGAAHIGCYSDVKIDLPQKPQMKIFQENVSSIHAVSSELVLVAALHCSCCLSQLDDPTCHRPNLDQRQMNIHIKSESLAESP